VKSSSKCSLFGFILVIAGAVLQTFTLIGAGAILWGIESAVRELEDLNEEISKGDSDQ